MDFLIILSQYLQYYTFELNGGRLIQQKGETAEILRLSSRVLTPWQPLVGKNDLGNVTKNTNIALT